MKKGLVIGKFYPPHAGHSYLIETGLSESDQLTVLVCDSPKYNIDAETRANWLKKIHPAAEVKVIEDIGKDDDSETWAEHTINFLGFKPDVVFTSEDYGSDYAKYMNCQHRQVDRARLHVPISATKVRQNVHKSWDYLKPVVRQNYCKRICIVGAESTGTTTLARALAETYETYWVPEYGRLYSEAKLTAGLPMNWDSDEFDFIAAQQQRLENELAGKSNGLIICDTDAFATRLWHKRYMGDFSKTLEKYLTNYCSLYIVTAPDIPFEQDGMRDGEFIRHDMHEWFIDELEKHHKPYILVSGSHEKRLAKAIEAINKILREKVTI
jgi:HTH-type transcriptional regulator, transcriptional repressor of NAD biosynthesis genes